MPHSPHSDPSIDLRPSHLISELILKTSTDMLNLALEKFNLAYSVTVSSKDKLLYALLPIPLYNEFALHALLKAQVALFYGLSHEEIMSNEDVLTAWDQSHNDYRSMLVEAITALRAPDHSDEKKTDQVEDNA